MVAMVLGVFLVGCGGRQTSSAGSASSAESTSRMSVKPDPVSHPRKIESVSAVIAGASAYKPIVFSHRGAPYNAPEHSFAGYDSAIHQGTTFIEQDVWLNKEGTLYVSHDNNLYRTTGANINITDSTNDQLSHIRLRNGEQLHPLSAIFQRYGRRVHYIIEAKNDSASRDLATQHALDTLLRQNRMSDNVIVQDTRLQGLQFLHECQGNQTIPMLWLMPGRTVAERLRYIQSAPRWVTFIALNLATVTEQDIVNIRAYHFLSNIWTIGEYSDNAAAKALGADSVFTNETAETLKTMN